MAVRMRILEYGRAKEQPLKSNLAVSFFGVVIVEGERTPLLEISRMKCCKDAQIHRRFFWARGLVLTGPR